MPRRLALAVVGALVALLLASACGTSNGSDVKPGTYAETVCSALRAWKQGEADDQPGRVFTGFGAALDRLGRSYPDKALNRAFDQQPGGTKLA